MRAAGQDIFEAMLNIDESLQVKLAQQLDAMDWRIRGRYGLLGRLARTMTSARLIESCPALLVKTPPPWFHPNWR